MKIEKVEFESTELISNLSDSEKKALEVAILESVNK